MDSPVCRVDETVLSAIKQVMGNAAEGKRPTPGEQKYLIKEGESVDIIHNAAVVTSEKSYYTKLASLLEAYFDDVIMCTTSLLKDDPRMFVRPDLRSLVKDSNEGLSLDTYILKYSIPAIETRIDQLLKASGKKVRTDKGSTGEHDYLNYSVRFNYGDINKYDVELFLWVAMDRLSLMKEFVGLSKFEKQKRIEHALYVIMEKKRDISGVIDMLASMANDIKPEKGIITE